MSFLELIKQKQQTLNPSETIITTVNGEKFIETKDSIKKISNCHGFVVDTKPDLEIAEILPNLYLSSQDVAYNPEILKTKQIKNVLSIGVKICDSMKVDGIYYKFIPLLDLPESQITDVFHECFEFIQQSDGNVLVHCNAGVSRSPSIVILYLMQKLNMSFEKAFALVKSKRHCINPNPGFILQIKNFRY